MNIIDVDYCWDGGSALIGTDAGTYCVDRRIDSETPNAVYTAYPDEGGILCNSVRGDLLDALQRYGHQDDAIQILINDLHSAR